METAIGVLSFVFGGDTPDPPLMVHQVISRAVAIYLLGIVIVRCGKSRLFGRTTPLDVLLGFILGSLLSRGITGEASISGTLAGSAVLVATHYVLTRVALSNSTFESWLKGYSYPLIMDGTCVEQNMRRAHVSQSDLEEQLRQQGIEDCSDVKIAFKERNGEVSVIRNERKSSKAVV